MNLRSLINVKAFSFLFISCCISTSLHSQNVNSDSRIDTTQNNSTLYNNWSAKLIKSPFGLGLDIQTKYIWRGMEMMTEDASPVLFPSVNYSYKGLYIYFMGGYATNGKYAEVDAGISYSAKGFTIGINDYYYPTIDSNEDQYLGAGKHTGHWLEACLTYSPEKIPVWATLSNFFYGADKYINTDGIEKQAYSTYLEIGTYYDFLNYNRLSLSVGGALNKSCYNGYEHNFSIVNLELKYTYNVEFNNGWILPLNVSYIYNPVFDKSYVNFTANFAF